MRNYFRSLAAPLMIICTLIFWLGIEVIGFSLVYFAGMSNNQFGFSIPAEPKLYPNALYFSGVTLPTLGFGDVVPLTMYYRMMAAVEALIGFAIMTLSISYVLNIYRVIQQFRVNATFLYSESGSTGRVWKILINQWDAGRFIIDNSYFRDLHRNLLDWNENLHQLPLAFFFYSPRPFLSIPFTFEILGELLSIYRFGLPARHAVSRNPAIRSLTEGYLYIIVSIRKRFSLIKEPPIPEPVSFDYFRRYLRESRKDNTSINNFCRITKRMNALAGLRTSPDYNEFYMRYTEWHYFTFHVSDFVDTISKTLGYPLCPEIPGGIKSHPENRLIT